MKHSLGEEKACSVIFAFPAAYNRNMWYFETTFNQKGIELCPLKVLLQVFQTLHPQNDRCPQLWSGNVFLVICKWFYYYVCYWESFSLLDHNYFLLFASILVIFAFRIHSNFPATHCKDSFHYFIYLKHFYNFFVFFLRSFVNIDAKLRQGKESVLNTSSSGKGNKIRNRAAFD